jgi:hypothetical protein
LGFTENNLARADDEPHVKPAKVVEDAGVGERVCYQMLVLDTRLCDMTCKVCVCVVN